jgi:hypothetical protein
MQNLKPDAASRKNDRFAKVSIRGWGSLEAAHDNGKSLS